MLRLPLFFLLLLSAFSIQAQPTISFQIRNEVRKGTTYEFDIYARGDTNLTFHNRGQIYLNYSKQAFGDSIVIRRKIKRPRHLFLLNELSFVGPKYVTLNYVDNTESRIGITWESNFSGIPPLPGAHTELPPKWTSLYHIEIEMQDTTAEPSINFQHSLMVNQQFYLFAVNDERAYTYIPSYPTFLKRAKGRVFWDENNDSTFSQADIPLADWIVRATPGPYYSLTDSQGLYSLQLDTGNFQLEIFPPRGRDDFQAVPATFQKQFKGNDLDQGGLDFAVSLDSCPLSEVRIFAGEHSFCDTNTIYIQYANRGILPLDSAQIAIRLPGQLSLTSCSHPFQQAEPGLFQFHFPSLPPLTAGVIKIQDSSSCDMALREKALCIEASMTPENFCAARDTSWSGAILSGRTFCDPAAGNVYFVIENTGTANMLSSTSYYVMADDSLIYADQLQLVAGDSLRMFVKDYGQSIRLVVKQVANHPTHHWFSIHYEGCGSPASTDFVSAYPASDPDYLTKDITCLEFTPKRSSSATFGSPWGLGPAHYIGDTTELTVGVRFQNGLPNRADGWIMIDSLSPDFDPLSFRPGPLTQPGDRAVYGKGQLILDHFGFELPEAAVVAQFFRITPKAGSPAGTLITNTAGSCIDTFPPIMSDTLLRTIGRGLKTALSPGRIVLNPPNVSIDEEWIAQMKIFPNPAQDQLWIRSDLQAFTAVSCHDLAGREIIRKEFSQAQKTYQLSLPPLAKGLYIISVQTSKGRLDAKITIQ